MSLGTPSRLWLLGAAHWPFSPRLSLQRFKSEDAPKIHMALSVSLFLLNLTFLINVGSSTQGTPASCRVRAAMFHYFLLCVFTWMGLEAFHLYLLAIRVFNTYFGHYFLKLSLLGWGRHRLEGSRGRGQGSPKLERWVAGGTGDLHRGNAGNTCFFPLSPGLPVLMVIGAGSSNSYGIYTIRDQENRTSLEL